MELRLANRPFRVFEFEFALHSHWVFVMSWTHLGPIEHLIKRTCYSFQRLRHAWAKEVAFRYEIYLLIMALPAAWFLGKSAVEQAVLIVPVLLVIVLELINASIETTVDRIGKESNDLPGYVKHLASAAVFVSILLAAAV